MPTHTKQLLLVTFCDRLAGIEVRFGRTEPKPQTDGTTDRWTDRRGSQNSYLDVVPVVEFLGGSDEIQIDFHIAIYIVKGFFDILLRLFESEPSKIGQFQSLQSFLQAK